MSSGFLLVKVSQGFRGRGTGVHDGIHDILGADRSTRGENAGGGGPGRGQFGLGAFQESVRGSARAREIFQDRVRPGKHSQGEDDQIVFHFLGKGVAFLPLDAHDRIVLGVFGDPGHFGFHEIDPHGTGAGHELLVPFSEGPDIHVVNGDVGGGKGTGKKHGLLDGVHAADTGAVGDAQALVPASRALHVGDAVGDLAVRGTQNPPVGPVGGQEPFGLHGGDHVGQQRLAVLGFGVHGRQLVSRGQDDGSGFHQGLLVFMEKIDTVRGTGPGAGAAKDTVVHIQDGVLGNGVGEGDADGFARPQAVFVLVGDQHRANLLAPSATDAGVLVDVPGLLPQDAFERGAVLMKVLQLRVGPGGDIRMVGDGSHARGGDTAGAIQGGENLAQVDHASADARLFFHQDHFFPLVSDIQGGLEAGNASAHNENVTPDGNCFDRA